MVTNLNSLPKRYSTSAVLPFCFARKGIFTYVSYSPNKSVPLGRYRTESEPELGPLFTTPPDIFDLKPLVSPKVLQKFELDDRFIGIVQNALKLHLHESKFFRSLAMAERNNPFLHVFDFRCPPMPGRIPEVEDILGTALIEDSSIVPGSYEVNPMYRPVSCYGPISLTPSLTEIVRKELERNA